MGDLWFYESIMVFRINPIGSTTFYKRSFVQQAAERSTWNIWLKLICLWDLGYSPDKE